MKIRFWFLTFPLFLGPVLTGPDVESTTTVLLTPVADATLIEHPSGALANGTGSSLFAGRTGQSANGVRRAVLRFDVAGAIPAGAKIEAAVLTLHASTANGGTRKASVHRLLAEWREGPSVSSGGRGAPAEAGDVTWIHADYDQKTWARAGGHFVAAESASVSVPGVGPQSWSGSRLVRDVRLWSKAPARNFGWLLAGDESESSTVARFESREHADPSRHPVLAVTYRARGPR